MLKLSSQLDFVSFFMWKIIFGVLFISALVWSYLNPESVQLGYANASDRVSRAFTVLLKNKPSEVEAIELGPYLSATEKTELSEGLYCINQKTTVTPVGGVPYVVQPGTFVTKVGESDAKMIVTHGPLRLVLDKTILTRDLNTVKELKLANAKDANQLNANLTKDLQLQVEAHEKKSLALRIELDSVAFKELRGIKPVLSTTQSFLKLEIARHEAKITELKKQIAAISAVTIR
jgi:hypothetical protein